MTQEKLLTYIPKKYQAAIVDIEICSLDGYFIYLNDEYFCVNSDSHTCIGTTINELLTDVRSITKKAVA